MSYEDSIDVLVIKIDSAITDWISSHSLDCWEPKHAFGGKKRFAQASRLVMAEAMKDEGFYQCPTCGDTYDSWSIGDYNKCDNDGLFCTRYTLEQCVAWVNELYYNDDEVANVLTPLQLDEAKEIAWNLWATEDFPSLPGLLKEADDALEELNSAKYSGDKDELLAALVMALHVAHVGGNIAQDYGCIAYSFIDELQQNGLEAVYGTEEIEYFLS